MENCNFFWFVILIIQKNLFIWRESFRRASSMCCSNNRTLYIQTYIGLSIIQSSYPAVKCSCFSTVYHIVTLPFLHPPSDAGLHEALTCPSSGTNTPGPHQAFRTFHRKCQVSEVLCFPIFPKQRTTPHRLSPFKNTGPNARLQMT